MKKEQPYPMDQTEAQALQIGDTVYIGIKEQDTLSFQKATVVQPLFWNADATESDWEVETTNGYVCLDSLYLESEVNYKEQDVDIEDERI